MATTSSSVVPSNPIFFLHVHSLPQCGSAVHGPSTQRRKRSRGSSESMRHWQVTCDVEQQLGLMQYYLHQFSDLILHLTLIEMHLGPPSMSCVRTCNTDACKYKHLSTPTSKFSLSRAGSLPTLDIFGYWIVHVPISSLIETSRAIDN